MQDRYAGDIGDYSKFILLRRLFDSTNHRLGLVWYLYPDESHNDDGRHVAYLKRQDYRQADQDLIRRMNDLVDSGQRSIRALEQSGILPSNSGYFSHCVDFFTHYPGQSREHRQARVLARQQWLQQAIEAMRSSSVIVLDPDNGLTSSSIRYLHQKKAGKYAFDHELTGLFEGKNAMVIYHHLNRTKPHVDQINQRLGYLKSLFGKTTGIFALRFSAYSARVYFVVTEVSSLDDIRRRILKMMSGPANIGWSHVFEMDQQNSIRLLWRQTM